MTIATKMAVKTTYGEMQEFVDPLTESFTAYIYQESQSVLRSKWCVRQESASRFNYLTKDYLRLAPELVIAKLVFG